MDKAKELIIKYKEVISYLIFGVLTTVVNFIVYFLFARVFRVNDIISNVIAWVLSVLFAYITNKIYVFESKTTERKEIFREITSFFSCRALSGVMDVGLFALGVKLLAMNDLIMKIITQILVVILNYVFSKVFIFRKKKEGMK